MKKIKESRCTRMIAGLLAILLVFSIILPSYVQAASDEIILEENENQVFSEETPDDSEVMDKKQKSGISVSAKMKPATSEAIYTGNSGYFNLEIGVNDPNQNGTATVHVYIEDPDAILPQFENTIGKSITTEKGHVITLMEDPVKGRYLAIANVRNGDTVTQGIEIKYANGITAPTTLTVTQNDIEVILNGIDEADIVKEGGKLQFISTFYWKDVVKTANTTKPISIDENGKITGGPINYTISANSYNNTGHGDVYSAYYSLIDTLTLPDGLTFPSGNTVDIKEGSGDIWYLTTEKDGVSVRLATLSMEEMDGLEETALTIQILEKSERTLKFKIQVEQFLEETHVLPSPKVTMNLDVTK
ncbi:MAG: hypothetical protein PUA89_09825, partial [Frisingicoccus sp.]|uniref:hypothetical protein n=1 Tax=Frisingicoccus sp. TaxID=1918627 RepID=UPI002609A8EC